MRLQKQRCDLTTIKIKQSQDPSVPDLVMASAYMHEEESAPPDELVELVRYCEQNDMALIIGADANAHHPLWGMPNSNKRGEDLVDFLFTTDLSILNIGSAPTFVTRRARTIIDLTLATRMGANLVSDWKVSMEASCSDHRWITFKLAIQTVIPTPRRIPRKTNKKQYTLQVTQSLQRMQLRDYEDTETIDKTTEELTEAIMSGYRNACPLSTPRTNPSNKNSWWGPELARLRKKVRRLFNRAMNTCDDQDWDAYRDAKSLYKRRIRHWSDGSWRKFCTSIDTCSTANKVRKLLSKDNSLDLGQLCRPDRTTAQHRKKHRCYSWRQTFRFQPFKAAGPGGIFPALLQWAGDDLIRILVALLRACLAYRYTPKLWRDVRVTFIPKPSKSDYSEPKSYRSISISSFLLKSLKRLCDRKLRDNQLTKVTLHRNQHAYSPGKSTELHAVVSTIEDSLGRKELCLGTFIDIEGAFDKTSFSSITTALLRHGTDETIVQWISNILSNRLIRPQGENQLRALASRGCPQGGVLSPLLWNTVVNDLITRLYNLHYLIIGYADDLAILVPGKLADTVCGALRVVEIWCSDYGLKVCPGKTELVLFTNKRNLGSYRMPALFSKTLCFSKEVKYLGINLDAKLNWGTHINKTIKKACIILYQSKRMLALETILNVRPLHFYIEQEAACSSTRLHMLGLWRDNNTPHTSILKGIEEEYPFFMAKNDMIPRQHVFDKKYRIQPYEVNPDRELHKKLRVYPAGSKTNSGTGAGVFSEDINIHLSDSLGILNTVFQAECIGIVGAAEAITRRAIRGKNIRILSDSATVLQALDNNVMTSGLVFECHCKLMKVGNENEVIL
ncbi:hypothetical protein evm_004097 [Chilo suppressalis]|nr:hypothetical protein evm_004097 [Chilo suppressalis]